MTSLEPPSRFLVRATDRFIARLFQSDAGIGADRKTVPTTNSPGPQKTFGLGSRSILSARKTEFFRLDALKQSVRTIRYRDSPISFRPKANVLRLVGRPARMSNRMWRKHLADASLVSPRLVLTILATEKEDIYMMLKYFSEPGSWSTYYKVMETMETLARQKGFSVPVAKTAKSRFTNNANNFNVVGYDARHGLMPKGKDNPVEPMTLVEGHAFITGFCKSFLNLAYPEFFKFS